MRFFIYSLGLPAVFFLYWCLAKLDHSVVNTGKWKDRPPTPEELHQFYEDKH